MKRQLGRDRREILGHVPMLMLKLNTGDPRGFVSFSFFLPFPKKKKKKSVIVVLMTNVIRIQ